MSMLTKVAAILTLCLGAGWWTYDTVSRWEARLLAQGRTECIDVARIKVEKTLKDNAERARLELEEQSKRALVAERDRDAIRRAAAEQLAELMETRRTLAFVKQGACPAPTLSDRTVNIINAPVRKP